VSGADIWDVVDFVNKGQCAHSHSPSQIVGNGLVFRAFDIQEGVLEVSAELRGMLAESDIPTSSTD
jgi:hypothetical protein